MIYSRLLAFIGIFLLASIARGQDPIPSTPFFFATPELALKEIQFPKATESPNNSEIFARYEALNKALDKSERANNIRLLQSYYGFYTRLLSGISGYGVGLSVDAFDRNNGHFLTEEAERAAQLDEENPLPSALPNLAWSIALPETIRSGEHIPMEVALKNITDHDVVSGTALVSPAFCLASIRLIKVGNPSTPVLMTKLGASKFYNGWFSRGVRYGGITIKAGDEMKLDLTDKFKLDKYYDVSEPGEYELTFYTRRFLDENGEPAEDQELEYPRKATVRFTILP